MKPLSFPKPKRLVKNRQFKAVLDQKRRVSNGLLTLFVAQNDRGRPRLGVSVGKACGNAVARNRLKRLLREAFRRNQNCIPPFDYLIMISPHGMKKVHGAPNVRTDHREERKQAKITFDRIQTSFLALVPRAIALMPQDRQDRRNPKNASD